MDEVPASLNSSSDAVAVAHDITNRESADGKCEQVEKMKDLVVNLFGEDRYVGVFPTRLHSDLRHLVEMYRRGKQPRLAASRLEAMEQALASSSASMKHSASMTLPSSSGELRAQVEAWRSGARRSFDAETYYDKSRTAGYTKKNRGSQDNLSRRTLELCSFSTCRPSLESPIQHENLLVIDLGCGSGLSTKGAVELPGYRLGVIGVDLSTEMLRSEAWNDVADVAAPLAGERVRCDLAQPLPFRTRSFDAAYSVGAVHYLAQDSVQRSAASRLDSFTSSLRSCLAENARPVVCQAFLTSEPSATEAFKNSAARTGWALCDLIQDKAHTGNTTERDFLYLLSKPPASDFPGPPRCAMYHGRAATCVLALRNWARQHGVPQPSVDASHIHWLEREHDRFAKKLVRLRSRCATEGATLDHSEPLDRSRELLAEKLNPLVVPQHSNGDAIDGVDPEGQRLSHIIAALHEDHQIVQT